MEILSNILINGSKYKKGHIEKDFEAEVFKHLRKHGHYCYHIPDVWLGLKLVDAICIGNTGMIYLIEFKITTGYTFNMSQFQPIQIQVLEFCRARSAPAWVMVYSTKTETYWVGTYEYLKSQANSAWWIKLFEPWKSS